ncbi:Transposase [Oceanobacillus picturae]|uniref:Transposase n=1 Tax=Oceanobacillus picturae TaxID=171693 RepID=W9AIK6_9BACI|nr:Transposase [Oceanobacillus picturae]
MSSDNSLSHTRWNCKYHLVFIPKYRRKLIYGKLRRDIGAILRRLCEMKDVEIIEAHAMPDHIHMLVKIPPKMSVSYFMGYLKGKSSLMIHDRHANQSTIMGTAHFGQKVTMSVQ